MKKNGKLVIKLPVIEEVILFFYQSWLINTCE
jgi:hypothetical protein